MVSPTAFFPPGDISLSDGTTTLYLQLADSRGNPDSRAVRQMGMPRTSLQMTTSDPDYGSFVLPNISIVQKDFSGGRGLEDFTKDTTRYYDSYNVDTRAGDVLLGPSPSTWVADIGVPPVPDSTSELSTTGSYGSSFVASSEELKQVPFQARSSSGTVGFVCWIYTNSGGAPSQVVAIARTVNVAAGATLSTYTAEFGIGLTVGATYWFVVTIPTNGILGYYASGYSGIYKIGTGVYDADGQIYMNPEYGLSGTYRFFEYKRQMFAIWNSDFGATPRLYQNGFRGFSSSNTSLRYRLLTSLDLSGVDLTGCIALLIAGPGSEEVHPYRTITSNTSLGTNDTIYVSPPWKVAHTTATEFVILGYSGWFEITGHGLTKPITDVLVVDDIVYFCQGDATVMRKARLNAGSWSYDDEGASTKCTYIDLIPGTDGKRKIWLAQATTSNVYSADPVSWSTDLTLSTAIVCGNPASRITNLLGYGQPRIPYILKEDSFGSISNGVYAEVPLSEMKHVKSYDNGKAAAQFGVYLYFSLLQGLERYYDSRLDDIGPNRDEGFPESRRGVIADLIEYPGGLIATIDAGVDGWPCIIYYTQVGWHEIYRNAVGGRIRNLAIQAIPGDVVDSLWFAENEYINRLPITLSPRKQTGYTYTSNGHIITSWFKTQFAEVIKSWKSLTLFTENLSSGHQTITAYYQTDTEDDDDSWHALPTTFTSSPIQEVDLSATHNITGKRIRFKLELATDNSSVSPRIKALTLNAVCRVPQKRSYSFTFMAESAMRDANGHTMALDMDSLLDKLQEWADSNQRAAPLFMRSTLRSIDGGSGRYVHIDPPNQSPVYVERSGSRTQAKYVITMAVYEA